MVKQLNQKLSRSDEVKLQMSNFKCVLQPVKWFLAILLVTLASGCGGSSGNDDSPSTSGVSSIAVTHASSSIPIGGTQQSKATATYSDGSSRDVTNYSSWTSGTTSIATTNSTTGLSTGVAIGTSSITATFGGKSHSATLTVSGGTLNSISVISVSPTTASAPVGFKQKFIAIGAYTDGSSADISSLVTWTSNNTAIATILSPGIATGVSIGTAIITATSGGKSGTANFVVNNTTLVSIMLIPLSTSVPKGFTQPYIATGILSDGTSLDITDSVTWTSSNTALATIDSDGVVSGVTFGIVTITGSMSGISGTASLTVSPATLTSIFVKPAIISVPNGFAQKFVAVGAFSDGTSFRISDMVTWSSSNNAVATIVSPGFATGLSVGTTTIKATMGAVSGTASLTVTNSTLSSIAVTPVASSIISGGTQNFIAIGAFSDGTSLDISDSVLWTSNNNTIATVLSPGIVTGVSGGLATIKATSGNTSGNATTTVTGATLNSIVVAPLTASVPSGITQLFVATGSYSNGTSRDISNTVTWTSNSTSIATVDSTGLVTSVSAGNAIITATSGDKSGTATLTVGSATLDSISVTPFTPSVPTGFTHAFVAIGAFSDGTSLDMSDTVTWSSNNTTIATVVSPGIATGITVGTTLINATSGTKTGSTSLTVLAGTVTLSSIAVTPVSASVAIGSTQAFIALGVFSDGSNLDISNTVTWSSDSIAVASILPSGVASALSAGNAIITATLGTKSGSATLTVVTTATLNSIAVTPTTSTTSIGATQSFIANGTFSDNSVVDISSTVTWSSNNLPVATVLSNGVATGVSGGTATITATSGTKSGSGTLIITTATLSSIAVTPALASIPDGGSQAFIANGTYSDNTVVNLTNTVSWTSSDLAVATVLASGVANGLSGGTSTITATSGTKSGTAVLTVTAALGPAPVNLGTAGNFVILTKAGITNAVAATLAITGDIGTSPITGAAMNTVPCASIAGSIFTVDAGYSGGACNSVTAANKTIVDNAVLDMELAFTDAAGRATPDAVDLGAGDISGMTLAPGLYKWGTGVLITNAGVTLAGGPNDVWIFQIGQDLTLNSGAIINLTGGALPKNIFWQVDGKATLDTTVDFKGILLSQTLISVNTTAVVNGRLLAQTEVTLQGNTITEPAN